MNMQDKEFDQIFNSKFENFEVEPSPMLWDNIADELDGKKNKRSLISYLSLAASVVVILTAGMLFLNQKDKPAVQPNHETKLAVNRVKLVAPLTTRPVKKATELVSVEKPVDRIAIAATHQPENTPPVNKAAAPVITKPVAVVKEVKPVKAESPQLIAVVTPPAKVTVPDVRLTPAAADVIARAPVETPAAIASNDRPEPALVKKRGIHNLGGLINALVAKVDKREDKLIEFSDSDDDDNESELTGVNLGLIKIKKQ
ncbi:hypothetical protein [Mucilaginibacter sp. UR6-11]|uniref:hypothetical protein n=1 Tax=Mucilaginibacter sp. UR6-11 TaxID=1435644 RepID=UPI001E608D4E|nr:hypothetical protein [Mucilaginibacter sp. UR6-11]MCC8424207.1 hypothetical protein [Mucilaginibacter sp. UR6-11]